MISMWSRQLVSRVCKMRSVFFILCVLIINVAFCQDIVFQDESRDEEQLDSRAGLLSLDTKLFRYPCYEVGQISCKLKCQQNGFQSHRCVNNRFCACANTGGLLSSLREAVGSVTRGDAFLYSCNNPQYIPCTQACADSGYEYGSCTLLGSLCVCSHNDTPEEGTAVPEGQPQGEQISSTPPGESFPSTQGGNIIPPTTPAVSLGTTESIPLPEEREIQTDPRSCYDNQIVVIGMDCKENDHCRAICRERGGSFYLCKNSTFCACATSQQAILSAPESPYSGRTVTYFTPNEPCTDRCYGYCEDYKGADRCLYTYCSHRHSKCVCLYTKYGEN